MLSKRIPSPRQLIAARRERDMTREADYHRWRGESQRRFEKDLLDEITDQSERLAAPMENSFSYSLDRTGQLITATGDSLRVVLQTGLDNARAAAKVRSDVDFEVHRRELELDELELAEQLARGVLGDITSFVVFSPIPDAVKRGETTIDGYDRERQKLMVRIWQRSAKGVETVSMSLDRSDYAAMQAAIASIGYDLPAGLGSEEILARRFVSEASLTTLRDGIRMSYDTHLSHQFGGTWHAGRQFDTIANAREFVEAQPDLLAGHMNELARIVGQALPDGEKNSLKVRARYDFAAALDDRLHGRIVASLRDSGDAARSEGKHFDGDCPTFSSNVSSATGQLERMGMLVSSWSDGTCRVCLTKTQIGTCAVCRGCEQADNRGGKAELDRIHAKAKKRVRQLARPVISRHIEKKSAPIAPSRTPRTIAISGKTFIPQTLTLFGDARRTWVDAQTGEELAKEAQPPSLVAS